ncbi:peptidase U32 family protein [Rickettsiales bacterium LUAb2]
MTLPKKPELLVPAGNLTRLKTAIRYGADSVYVGSPAMSLRSKSTFTLEEIREGSKIVKDYGKKLYLTLNLFSHNSDVEKLPKFVELINDINPDGVLIADPGIFMYIKENAPNCPLHISTQANVCSWISVDYWKKQGASLCVMAREVTFDELKEIREKCPDIKLEAFIHGSMCMTYSGRCLLSNFMAERGSNQGSCAHSCRWNYKIRIKADHDKYFDLNINDDNKEFFKFAIEEEFREGEYYPIEEDDKGSYILNAKDLCLMPVLKDYIDIGVDTLKIEGRNKSEYYVAMVTRAYRKAIDDYVANPDTWDYKKYMDEIYSISNRGYTTAFHNGRLTDLAHSYDTSKSTSDYLFAGAIIEHLEDAFLVEVKNYIISGDVLEFISPNGTDIIRLRMYEFIDANTGASKDKVSAGSKISNIKIPYSLFHNEEIDKLKEILPVLSVIRKFNPDRGTYRNLIKFHKSSLQKENDEPSFLNYDNLKNKVKQDNFQDGVRKPCVGDKGCCYKGCNGCLVFWKGDKASQEEKEQYKVLK